MFCKVKMKLSAVKLLFLPKFLLLFLLPYAIMIKMEFEDEHCRPEDKVSTLIPFGLFHKDVCPLVKDVLLETTYEFPMHCAQKCLTDVFCAGYNFKTKQTKKKPNCQLTHKLDHKLQPCNKDDKGWNFHKPLKPKKVSCQKLKYCKYGGRTVIDVTGGPGSDPYRCECLKGFKGDLCEISPFLPLKSTILSGEPQSFQYQINKWLPGSLVRGIICWRASRDGWAVSTFHSNCINKAPTLTIIKVGTYIFGGYSTASWDGSYYYKKAPGSFMFSLRNKENLPPFKAALKHENTGNAIYGGPSYGPTFGGGHDLYISDNAGSNTNSYTSFNNYYQAPSGVSDTQTILAGTYTFSPSDVEVFYLV